MKIKVHWIIDGIAETEADNIETAEAIINEKISKIVKENEYLVNELGAKSIQGKGYLPGSEEN
tara:strand:+ start:284 stop:472 length:189 start_codon:yes stop_codon:yes gene_type:complete